MTGENVTCTSCAAEVDALAVFPGQVCLECHARATENDTPEELLRKIAGGFGAGSIRKRGKR